MSFLYLNKHHSIKMYLLLNYKPHMKTYGGSGHTAPQILKLSTRWRLVVSFTPQGTCPWYPLTRRLGGPQSWSGHGSKEEKTHRLSGIENQLSSQ